MNANLCSAAIWPEMGESAALTTGSEAESISAHFLDHLVPHPKRGKYGLYHSPTLSFLSLHFWLRAVGTRTARPGWVSTRACWGAAWKGSPLPPPPHPTLDFRFKEGGAAAERSDGLSTQAGEEEGECRAIPDCPERCWSPAGAGLHPLESPPPLSVSRELGALNAQEGEPWGWGVGRRGGEAERPADTLEVRQARPLVQARLTERSQGPDRRPGAGPGGA